MAAEKLTKAKGLCEWIAFKGKDISGSRELLTVFIFVLPQKR
jgi:hypothetical protein